MERKYFEMKKEVDSIARFGDQPPVEYKIETESGKL